MWQVLRVQLKQILTKKPILPLELCEYGPRKLLNMDLFEVGKKDFLTTTCKLSGLILGESLANKSYKITTDSGQELVRNGSHVRHSERETADLEQRS